MLGWPEVPLFSAHHLEFQDILHLNMEALLPGGRSVLHTCHPFPSEHCKAFLILLQGWSNSLPGSSQSKPLYCFQHHGRDSQSRVNLSVPSFPRAGQLHPLGREGCKLSSSLPAPPTWGKSGLNFPGRGCCETGVPACLCAPGKDLVSGKGGDAAKRAADLCQAGRSKAGHSSLHHCRKQQWLDLSSFGSSTGLIEVGDAWKIQDRRWPRQEKMSLLGDWTCKRSELWSLVFLAKWI